MIARVLCAAPRAPFWHQAAAHARVSAAPAAAFPGLLPRAVDAFHLYSWADAAACSAAHTCLLAPCRSCGAGTWCSQCRMAGRGPRSCCANPPACAHREGVCCLCGAGAWWGAIESVHGRCEGGRGKERVRHRGAGRRRGSGSSRRPPRSIVDDGRPVCSQGLSCRPHAGARGAAQTRGQGWQKAVGGA